MTPEISEADGESYESKVENLKQAVIKMRHEYVDIQTANETAAPSPIWAPVSTLYGYITDLSAENLRNIRLHTGIISAPILDIGLFGTWNQEEYTEEQARQIGYATAIEGLPEKYWLTEPPLGWGIERPLGQRYRGRIVNEAIARFQNCVSNLFHIGILESMLAADDQQVVVEIGGGYGGLAHSLGSILNGHATYIIVDFPDMLMFSGTYVILNNPDQSIYVYDSETFTPEFVQNELTNYDFVLVPNFALSKMINLQKIDCMINMTSFQEMTETQVEEYLKFGVSRLTGYLYSDNVDKHVQNPALNSISVLLERYFQLFPSPSVYDDLFRGTHMGWHNYSRKYFGIPSGSSREFPNEGQFRSLFSQRPKTTRRIGQWKNVVRPFVPMALRRLLRRLR